MPKQHGGTICPPYNMGSPPSNQSPFANAEKMLRLRREGKDFADKAAAWWSLRTSPRLHSNLPPPPRVCMRRSADWLPPYTGNSTLPLSLESLAVWC